MTPAYSWPTVMGTGMVFWLQASQFQICMSVPQMAEVWMRMSTSLGPMAGMGTSSIHSPRSRLLLTSAFMETSDCRGIASGVACLPTE